MSISLILLPLSIALGASVSATAISTAAAATAMVGSKTALAVAAEANLRHLKHLRELYEKGHGETLPPIETIFNDMTLLQKTLEEHGLSVSVVSDHQLLCRIGEVLLDYTRQTAGEPFRVAVSGLQNIDNFLNEMECFEREYKQNVQSYTYNKLINNLSESNMTVAEETVLEDNSILLTINI
ncbi:MAG: hypothetical protein LBS36_10695 [Oscillospiraceae bacterium]|jgi:hypothetical protein|nr:hypothetical protein [Oscillospiraceae bacterium]